MFNPNTAGNTIKEEYYALKNGSGIHVVKDALIVQLIGKDTIEFLHRISSNAVKDLNPFEKRNTLFLNEKGRFIDKTTFLNFENLFLLIGSPDNSKKLLSWINKFIIMEDIQTMDISTEYLFIELLGPQSESYLTLLIGDEIKSLTQDNIIVAHADGFTFNLFKHSNAHNKDVFNILIKKEVSAGFFEYMLENKSVFDVCLLSDEVYNIARIECGIPVSPNEINDEYNPFEINLISEVNFKKGCYIGQEVIARLETYDKIQKKMVGIILPDDVVIKENEELIDEEGNKCGLITSTAHSELLNKKIALCILRKKLLEGNKPVFVKSTGANVPVTVIELPFRK